MVTYAPSPAQGQALLSRLNGEFMRGMPQCIEASSFLKPDFKRALLDCYDRGPSPHRMVDAIQFGLIGSELVDESSPELTADGGSLHGPSRLSAVAPVSHEAVVEPQEVARQLLEIIRCGDPSQLVLELFGMQRSPYGYRVPIERALTETFLQVPLGQSGRLYAGSVQSGVFRLPSLSLVESSLQYLYGSRAPRFCWATDLIRPVLLNAFHEIDHRMICVGLEARSFDGHQNRPPIEVLFHDLEHALDFVKMTPFLRRISARFLRIFRHYQALVPPTELFDPSGAGRYYMRGVELFILNLIPDLIKRLRDILRNLRPQYADAIARHCLEALAEYRETQQLSGFEAEEWQLLHGIVCGELAKGKRRAAA